MSKNTYVEKQYFTQWWLWLLLGGIYCGIIALAMYQWITGEQVGDKPASDVELIILVCFFGLFIGIFSRFHLFVRMDDDQLYFRFWPFVRRTKPTSELMGYELIDRGVVVNQGIKLSQYGWVYSIKGGWMVRLKFKDGTTWNLGTSKPKELENFLAKMLR